MRQQLLAEIRDASGRIRENILNTPLLRSPYLSRLTGGNVYLKMESEQYTGSFKARGSLNKLMWLREQQSKSFPVTASTGNHGLGFARALSLLDMRGRIYLPNTAVPSKVEAIKNYDVEIEFYGDDPYQTEIHTRQLAEENGWIYVSPYNDLQVIAGQGTIGMEITGLLDNPDCLLATVGGGGLISGIGTWMKELHPGIEVIGCQPEHSPEMSASIEAGEYKEVPTKPTLSDGSAGGFEKDSITFDLCKSLIDDFILVSEEEIKKGIRFCIDKHKKLVEGSSGVSVASLLKNPDRFAGKTTIIVICGANISYDTLTDIVCKD